MRIHVLILLATVLQLGLMTFTVSAHPSSVIVVDQKGNVFFSDLDRGVLKIDARGKVITWPKRPE
jgi:hypothetical protein